MAILGRNLRRVLTGFGLILCVVIAFLLLTDQPMIKLMRFKVFHSFEFDGGQAGDVRRDIAFKTVDGESLMVDLYMPLQRAPGPIPVVVFSHGGGWIVGDRTSMLNGPHNKELIIRLRQIGYAVANFEYRVLSESITLADVVADNKDIVRWLRANAGDYEFDPGNIGFWGQSAGAHLALMAGLSNENEFGGDPDLRAISARVAYVIDNFGPADLSRLLGPIVAGERSPGMMERQQLENMFDIAYQNDPEGFILNLLNLSPVTHVDAEDPPVLILHGDADTNVPYAQSLLLQERMHSEGARHELSLIEGAGHAFNGATEQQVADIVELSIAFIERSTSDEN